VGDVADDKRTPEQVEYARVDALLKSGQKPKLWKPVGVQLKGIHEADSAVDIYITTNEIDRDGDLVNQKGMKLPDGERVPLVAAHFYYDLMNHIGAVEGIKAQATRIAARPRYFTSLGNMQADWAYMLVKLGVAAYSIGFIPGEVVWADYNDEKVLARIQAGKLARREFVTWELAETSHVIVPSNRGAVQRLADMGVLTGQAAEDALAKSVETPLSPKADLLLTKAFQMFEKERPTKAVVEIDKDRLQKLIDAKGVKIEGDKGNIVEAEEVYGDEDETLKGETEEQDVMALFTEPKDLETKGFKVTGARGLSLSSDEAWDAGKARVSMGDDMGVWKKLHIVSDTSAPEKKGSYKLPFGRVESGKAVASKSGLQAARQRLGATQGVDKAAVGKFIDSYLGAQDDAEVEEKTTMTIKLSEEDTQAIRDFTQTAIDDAFAEVRGDIEKLYEFLRDAGEEIKALATGQGSAKADVKQFMEDVRADVEKRLGKIPDDSAAYVTAKELIDAVMAGVREIVDERISVVRGDPEEFLRTKKVRRK